MTLLTHYDVSIYYVPKFLVYRIFRSYLPFMSNTHVQAVVQWACHSSVQVRGYGSFNVEGYEG